MNSPSCMYLMLSYSWSIWAVCNRVSAYNKFHCMHFALRNTNGGWKKGQDWFRNPWELPVLSRFVTSILSTYDAHKWTSNLLCSKVTRITWWPSNDCDVLREKKFSFLTYRMQDASLMTEFTWERDAEKPSCSSSTKHQAATERTRKFWWLSRAASFTSDKKCSSYCSDFKTPGLDTRLLISTLMLRFEHLPLFSRPQTKLREGNVFTHVGDSVAGVYPSMHHRSHDTNF